MADQASVRPDWPPLLLGAAAIVPGALALRQGRRRPNLAIIGLVLAIFLLVGCFGLGFEFWGTIGSEARFTELEFLDGDAVPVVGTDGLPADTPQWHMRGLADYTVDIRFGATDDEGNEAVIHCSGTATYNVEAQIFKDIAVNLE